MDKSLRDNIEKLAQADRLAAEEKMATKNIAGIIEVNEDIEDQLNLIEKLERTLKNWNRVFWVGFVVLIIILLYMFYYTILYHTGVEQTVTESVVYYKTDVPQIDKNMIEHINLHDIGYASTTEITSYNVTDPAYLSLDNAEAPKAEVTTETVDTVTSDYLYIQYNGAMWHWIDDTNRLVNKSCFYNTNGVVPKTADELAQYIIPNDTIYFWESLVDNFNSQKRRVIASDSDLSIPCLTVDYNVYDDGRVTRDIPTIYGEVNYLFDYNNNIYIYSDKTANMLGADKIADVLIKYNYDIAAYDGVDATTIKSAIQNILTSDTYGVVQSELFAGYDVNSYKAYMDSKVVEAVSSVSSEFSITRNKLEILNTAGGEISVLPISYENPQVVYSTCEASVNDNGQIVIISNGVESIPEQVTKLNVTDYEILYDELACAYHYGWY